MKENKTSRIMQQRFARGNRERGFVGGSMPVQRNNLREKFKNESQIRTEIQNNIMKMVQNKKTVDEIREFLNQDKYKSYEQYFEIWIQNWIIKSSSQVKTMIELAFKKDKSENEIIQELENTNNEVYELYKNQVDEYVKSEIETRKIKGLKQQTLNKQEEGR